MRKSVLFLVAILMMGTLSFAQLSEDFETVTVDENIALDGWTNYAEEGTRMFIGKYYADEDNSYAQMSAYNSGEASEIAWLVTPSVTVGGDNLLTFRSKYGYNNADVASVWISTDFSGDVTGATWTELTSCVLPTDGDGGYGVWTESGDVDLSTYAGQSVNIAFKYTGGDPDATTTWQVDDVMVSGVVGVEDLMATLNIYPNPATDYITVENANEFNTLKVVNVAGQVVYTTSNLTSNTQVEVSSFQSGVYFIVLEGENGTVSQKFVK